MIDNVTGLSKDIWGDNAETFDPERFFEQKEPSSFEWTVFNCGPRICLGKQVAINEIKFVMFLILQRFTFELQPNFVPRAGMLRLDTGLLVRPIKMW